MKLIQIMPALLMAARCLSLRTNTIRFADLMAESEVDIPCSESVTGIDYLYAGDTLQLHCTLPPKFLNQNYRASQIRFKKTYPLKAKAKKVCIDSKNMVVHNESTAELVLPNVVEKEVMEYKCVLEPCDVRTPSTDICVGSSNDIIVQCKLAAVQPTRVYSFNKNFIVQYKPHNVTNFTCILYNWNEDMKCTWQHPVQYITRYNDTRVTCSYNTETSMNKTEPCPNLTFSGSWWEKVKESLTHTIQINVTNTRTNDTSSTTFEIEPLKEVKPAAPKDIKVNALEEADCFNITWQYHRSEHSGTFNISHQGPSDADWTIIASGLQEMFWKICRLKPFTSHKFSVICFSKYPSDPSSLTYTTPQRAPLSGPEAVNGSYTTGDCDTRTQQRNITLFWKDVKEADKNGIIRQYLVSFLNLKNSVTKGNYRTTVTIPCTSHGVTIKLFAENDAGVSVNPTILAIAPYYYKVPLEVKESFSIEIVNNTVIKAVWPPNSQNESANFVVFWLRENSQEHISSKPAPKDQSYIHISITDPLNYDFGLAMSDDNFSWTSPIEWATCFYEATPTSLPESVEINVIPDEESAIIIWQNMKCSKVNRFKISGFYILYCPLDKCNSSTGAQRVSVSARESYHKLSNLTAQTSYSIRINIESLGVEGQWSRWKQFSTKPKSDETELRFFIILIPTLTVIFFIGASVLFIICKRSKQHMKTLTTDTEEAVGFTNQNTKEAFGSVNGTNISTSSNPSVKEPLVNDGMESDYCEDSSEIHDSSSLLLNPSTRKSESNGKTIIPMTDFSQLPALAARSEDYSAILIIEQTGEISKELASELLNVNDAQDKNSQVEETQLITPSEISYQ